VEEYPVAVAYECAYRHPQTVVPFVCSGPSKRRGEGSVPVFCDGLEIATASAFCVILA